MTTTSPPTSTTTTTTKPTTTPLTTLCVDATSATTSLDAVAALLRANELVAFRMHQMSHFVALTTHLAATETVYGLGANALSASAVAKVFVAKGRPSDNPLIVHVSDWAMIHRVAGIRNQRVKVSTNDSDALCKDPEFVSSNAALLKLLSDRFWPGALTILMKRNAALPDNVTAGEPRVGVRMPDNDIALRLIRESDCPLAAPSANRSGRPSPTTAAHVLDDLNGRIAAIVDGGPCQIGVESTVIDALAKPPLILRPGGVTLEQLRTVLPDIELYNAKKHGSQHHDKPATPGLKYRHYAPNAPVVLVERTAGSDINTALVAAVNAAKSSAPDTRVGFAFVGAASHDNAAAQAFVDDASVVLVAMGATAEQVAQSLYGALRQFDDARVDAIVLQGVEEAGTGIAVLNRMRKAASSATELTPHHE